MYKTFFKFKHFSLLTDDNEFYFFCFVIVKFLN